MLQGPLVVGDVVCGRERGPLGAGYVDFHPLFVAHGLEVRGRPLKPDLIRYAELERRGSAAFFAARRRGVPVGYSCHLAFRSLHDCDMLGHDDFWFVTPELRGQGIGTTLRRLGLAWLKSMKCVSVECIIFRDRANRSILKRLGYERQGIRWIRLLDDMEDLVG